LIWLVLVGVSFCGAGVVVYGNVRNWANQPSVVTSVDYALVEVKNGSPFLVKSFFK